MDQCSCDSGSSLPPANEVWGKVIFLHLSVILFTGGVPGQVHPRQVHPPGQVHPPWTGTPPGQVPLRQVHPPGQVHTPQAGTPRPPRQGPPGGTPLQCMLGYGQQAGGTHPTGMHSCYPEKSITCASKK